MDVWSPIQGITLERYAELAASLEGVADPAAQAARLAAAGVAPATFEAARAGFVQRMADPANHELVARFGGFYHAARARQAYPQAAYPGQAQPGYAQPAPYPPSAGAQLESALGAFGAFMENALGSFTVGARVLVQWSDGNRYPATVTAARGNQVEVAFPDGRRVWVAQAYVSFGGV